MRLASDINREMKQFGLENTHQRYYSSYRGVVIDNEDPEMLGRLMLSVPQVWGVGVVHEYWAWSKGMFAGAGIGLFAIPNKGDLVWVSFEAGNQNMPIWEYGHFGITNDANDVPEAARNNGIKPTNVVLQSTSKHRIELDDKNEQIVITSKHGDSVVLNKNGISLAVKDSRKISHGDLDGSPQKAVLGDKQKTQLDDILDQIVDICEKITELTVMTAAGESLIPVNASAFVAIKAKITAIKGKLPSTLSDTVTLK